ncbi:Uncharacterised protein [Acinetobacter baumannii]|nr:Uncharacterised protein [Acinetobacter baumannii]
MPIEARFQFVARAQPPIAQQPQTVAVLVVAPAAIERRRGEAIGQFAPQRQPGVAFATEERAIQRIAVIAATAQFEIGVPVVAEVARRAQRRPLEVETAEVALVPTQLQALGSAFEDFRRLPPQLLAVVARVAVAQCAQGLAQRFAAMAETHQRLDPLRRIQLAALQQALQGGAILAAQGGLDLFVAPDLQAPAARPGQPVILQRLLVGGGELVEELLEPQLQHRRLAIPGPPRLALGEQRPLGHGEQAQVGGEAVRGGPDRLAVEPPEQ